MSRLSFVLTSFAAMLLSGCSSYNEPTFTNGWTYTSNACLDVALTNSANVYQWTRAQWKNSVDPCITAGTQEADKATIASVTASCQCIYCAFAQKYDYNSYENSSAASDSLDSYDLSAVGCVRR